MYCDVKVLNGGASGDGGGKDYSENKNAAKMDERRGRKKRKEEKEKEEI